MIKNIVKPKISEKDQVVIISKDKVAFSGKDIYNKLLVLDKDLLVLKNQESIGLCVPEDAINSDPGSSFSVLAHSMPMRIGQFGDPEFIKTYGVKMAYMTGAMANGIASEDMVIASGNSGVLSSFGAAGLVPSRIEEAINKIQKSLEAKIEKGDFLINAEFVLRCLNKENLWQ